MKHLEDLDQEYETRQLIFVCDYEFSDKYRYLCVKLRKFQGSQMDFDKKIESISSVCDEFKLNSYKVFNNELEYLESREDRIVSGIRFSHYNKEGKQIKEAKRYLKSGY